MVSKRRINTAESEPGTSKKRARTKDKTKDVQQAASPKPKKQNSKTVNKKTEDIVMQDEKADSDIDELTDDEIVIPEKNSEPINKGVDIWPTAHMTELLRRMEGILPQSDNLLYKSRVEKLNWDEVAFKCYSGVQCRVMWDQIQKRLRRFRVLRELIEDAKIWISKPWTNFYRGNKTNRHPDMPRRPLSSYMIFYMKKKDKVLKENPGLEMTGLSKHIGEMYKSLSPKAKEIYNELAILQRRDYENKMETFYKLHPELVPNSKAAIETLPQTNSIPKKPPTPFKLFCEDKIKRHQDEPDFEKAQFVENCKEQWKNMSDKKKVFWINWALEKEAKYQEDVKKYQSENPNFVPASQKSILTKEERTIRERMAGKPEKPPNSAYSLFSRLMLASKNIKPVSPKDRMFLIAQKWKKCSDIEKKEYSDRVKHMLEQYKLQYAEYLESLPEDKRQEELSKNQPKKKKGKNVKGSSPTAEGPPKVTKAKKVKEKTDTKTCPLDPVTKSSLFEGEPEPPPATPYLLFLKTFQDSYPEREDALEVWSNMTEEQRSVHRRVLWDLKRVYIESYENFLKGLTQDELKAYSEWKKTVKMTGDDFDEMSDNNDSETTPDCSSSSESEDDDPKEKQNDDGPSFNNL